MVLDQDKSMAKSKWLSLFSSCLLQRSAHGTRGKCNIRKCEVIQAAPALNSEDETLDEVVLASISAQCFQSNIDQVQTGWSLLPPELLQDIAVLLSNISDQVRFRAVCTAWRDAVHMASAPKPSCNPCPIFVQLSDTGVCTTCTLSFFPCAFSDSYADLHQLGVVSGRICGTGHGWFVVFRDLDPETYTFSIVLLNPLTRLIINLPSSDSITDFKSIQDKRVAYEASGAAIALLDGSKSPVTGCIVMISWYPHGFYFLQYTGENHQKGMWTMVKLFSPGRNTSTIIGFAYHHGTIFALHIEGKVFLVDTASLSRIVVDIPPALKRVTFACDVTIKIVEASGEVFLVAYMWHKVVGYVFRLDLTAQPPRWQRTNNIGDRVLFVGLTELQCLTLPDHVNSNLRKNCIYSVGPRGSKFLTYSICIYQLDVGLVEENPIHHSKSWIHRARWLLPSLI